MDVFLRGLRCADWAEEAGAIAALFVRASDPRGRGERESGMAGGRKGQADGIKSNQMKPLGPVSKNASPFCDSAGRAAEYCAAAQAAPAPAGPGASGSGRARPPGGALRLCLACCPCTCTHWLARGRNEKKKKRTGQATSFQTNRRLGLALGPSHLIHRPPP